MHADETTKKQSVSRPVPTIINVSELNSRSEELQFLGTQVSFCRSYTFYLKSGMCQALWYCPWCGTKLPERLGEEWGRILEEE